MIRLTTKAAKEAKDPEFDAEAMQKLFGEIKGYFKQKLNERELNKDIKTQMEIDKNLPKNIRDSSPKQLDEQYIRLKQSDKEELLQWVLKEKGLQDFMTRHKFVERLLKIAKPFTSVLYSLLIDLLKENFSTNNLKILSEYSDNDAAVLEDIGISGLEPDNTFQLKAIKYFLDRNADLSILRDDSNWKSEERMKKAISSLSPDEQDALRSTKKAKLPTVTLKQEKLKIIKDAFNKYRSQPVIKAILAQKMTDRELLNLYDDIIEVITSIEGQLDAK